ncbi:phage tail sheath family protein [Nonomuraea sp. ZG12]|uniref:phage tail sheath family protein n=1 Tax=Nonomuraea sp. ZG12 TaxID=3452207 RepID=UPI003F8BDC94
MSESSPGVYWKEEPPGSRPIEGVATAVAAFIGFAEKGPSQATLVTTWGQYQKEFGGFVQGCYLPHAVQGYFANGGSSCYVIRVGADGTEPEPSAEPQAMLGPFRIVAREPVQGGRGRNEITVEVSEAPTEEGQAPPEDRFVLTVKRGKSAEPPITVSLKRGAKDFIATAVTEKSRFVTVEDTGVAEMAKPAPQTITLQAPPPAPAPPLPAQVSQDTYVGNAHERRGVDGLEAVDEVTMIAIPDLMSAFERGAIDAAGVEAVQDALITHCDLLKDRMAILDPLPGLSVDQVRIWREDSKPQPNRFATVYYPWLTVFDPISNGPIRIPPSGHIAGVWARNDATRGVHKAPANEVVRGAIALETQLTRAEQNILNPLNVNCIRVMPGRGIRVWGARTLDPDGAWQYLNVRRLFNYLQESILNGTQWVVFEPNDDALWARIRRTISAFLVMEWHRGALFGLTPDEAFYVKCDRDTNPAESISQGRVVCEIGIAPVKPAEFVVFQVSQMASGVSLVSE